jgi:hypothetical protein
MRLLYFAALALALVVLGCGSGSDGDNGGPATTTGKNSHGGFTGDAGATYHLLNRICGASPPDRLALDLGIKVNTHSREGIVSIAKEYAKGFQGPSRKAAFEGCLDALPAR